jgi:hypothetical protein
LASIYPPILSPINNYFTLWYTYLLTLYFIALNGLKIAHHFDGGKYTTRPHRFALHRFASLRIWWKVYTHFGRVKYGKDAHKVSSKTQKHGKFCREIVKFASRFAVVYMARHSQFITVYGSPFDLAM